MSDFPNSLTLLEALPISVVISDMANGTILWTNARNLELAGAGSPEQLIGRNLLEFIEPEQQAVALRDIEAVTRGESPEGIVYHLRRLDGGSADVLIMSALTEFADAPAMLSLVADVTPQQRACRDLAESEERYRQLVETSPDGLAVVVGEEIVYANSVLAHALGTAPEQLVGKSMFTFLERSFHRRIKEARRDLVLKGGSAPATPVVLIRTDGDSVRATAASSVVRWHGEVATQTLFRDIGAAAQPSE